jgi:alkaline phosphatase D
MRMDRRTFLGAAAATLAGCARKNEPVTCGPLDRPIFDSIDVSAPNLSGDPFTLGVASGDPLSDRVILWTRLAPKPLEGGGMPNEPVPVAWQLARDDAFSEIVSQGVASAAPELAHSVHVDAIGLDPDSWYFYRFKVGDAFSPVGRTRTAPCPGAEVESLRFAFASCQKYRAGRYTAHAHLAQEDLDLVFFLGDYIYESGGRDAIESPLELEEVTDLAGYRTRYALYKSDPNLIAAHAAFPWIVTWDDHEVENDYAGQWSADDSIDPQVFLQRRAAAYQAYYEHLPIRAAPPSGPNLQLHRSFEWGKLASMFVLDTRQHRDKYACGGDFGDVCAERDDPARSILGMEQEQWLHDGIRSSSADWRLIAQSVVMANLDFEGTVANFDQWDGFTASRQRLLDVIRESQDVVVLSGDIHVAGIADLTAYGDDPRTRIVATELVTTSITSGGDGSDSIIPDIIGGLPHIRYGKSVRGYMRAELRSDALDLDLRAVSTVLQPTADVRTEASWTVHRGEPGALPR